jgi:hypothetical protein
MYWDADKNFRVHELRYGIRNDGRKLLMEHNDVAVARGTFLRRIRWIRQAGFANVYHLHET